MKTLKVKQIDLLDGCEHVAIHHIVFPQIRDKGFYRTVTSYSAFFDSCKGRNKNKQFLFRVMDEEFPLTEYEKKRDALLPVTNHNSLYNFFDAIGYDRKKKLINLK